MSATYGSTSFMGAGVGADGQPKIGGITDNKRVMDTIKNHDPFSLRKFQRDRVESQAKLLQSDPMKLGYTQGQQRQMVDQAAQNAQAQRAAQTQQLGQQALAGQGFQQGAFSQAARQVGADAAQDIAQASSDVASLNEQKIQAEKDRILGEVEALRNRRQQNAQFWGQFGIDAAQTIGELAGMAAGM